MRKILPVLTIIFTIISSPALGNSERYPTNAEVESLRGKLRSLIQTMKPDIRTSQEKRQRQFLVNHWSKQDRATAPFLGNWSDFESSMLVYPAKTKNRVCLVYVGMGQADFELGRVVDGKLRNARKNLMLLEGNYLGVASISEGNPSIYLPYHSPRVLKKISTVASAMTESNNEQKAMLIHDFKKYGCLNP